MFPHQHQNKIKAPSFMNLRSIASPNNVALHYKLARIRKRIVTKQSSSTFHTDANEAKFSHYLQGVHKNAEKGKVDKENTQVREFKKKLKRVGKKVWVSAFKQNIEL